ncbi:General amino-acid permease GAP2 [Penicillium chermesinum]|uniref:General amino-acid permease GAP2 n=1 Tax=Penicillium chermesinum TaxID=63820 RepID=A0A9W9PIH8_9EURO|nr:General amino-acid permease GAP2 [Penicillium chermesinum]KAJ5247319.1 General amino-acid permease GAP2 [Penicillium chermesinum]KAJ6145563.1 General amino-acid permease GAP2 [Penicillium chermesinum]
MDEKKVEQTSVSPTLTEPPPVYGSEIPRGTWSQRFIDSFKQDPNTAVIHGREAGADGSGFDMEAAAENTARSPLQRRLKGRHLQMIAIGGSIGSGLFVGSGAVLSTGGPAALLIAYCLIGIMLFCTVHALGELAVVFPVAGSFSHYSTRFIDPAWGFAMGWNYAMQWLVVLPLEIVAASITIGYWHPHVSNAVWVTIFWLVIVAINLFGVKGYGEAEFVFAIIKVTAVIGFIILGIILDCGGGPQGGYIGGKFWHDPGAFHNGFKGVCSVFVNAAFAFAGTELVGLAAAETANPRKSLPSAIKQVFWRIALFYVVSLLLVGLLVPYNTPQLLNASSSAPDANTSPFVIAIKNAGISGLPSVMNVVIMISVLSVGNSSIYGSSRTLAALADQGQAPRFLAYIDRKGRPIWGIFVASVLGLLSYLAVSSKEGDVLGWMMAISGLSSVFTWGSVCMCHIRFRRAWSLQGHSLNELAFKSAVGVWGSWVGFIFNCLVLVAQFWVGFAPVGYAEMSAGELVESFFNAYISAPIVLLFYIPYKLWFRTKFIRAKDMDLTTGRRDIDLAYLIEQEKAEQAEWPTWKKIYKFFC